MDTAGVLQLAGHALNAGTPLAGRKVTVRLDGHLAHVIADGTLAKTPAAPIPADQRSRLRGARMAAGPLPPAPAGPISVQRRVSTDGVVMVTRQRLHIGRTHAGKTVTILVEDTHFRVLLDGEELCLHPRTATPRSAASRPTPRAPKPS